MDTIISQKCNLLYKESWKYENERVACSKKAFIWTRHPRFATWFYVLSTCTRIAFKIEDIFKLNFKYFPSFNSSKKKTNRMLRPNAKPLTLSRPSICTSILYRDHSGFYCKYKIHFELADSNENIERKKNIIHHYPDTVQNWYYDVWPIPLNSSSKHNKKLLH